MLGFCIGKLSSFPKAVFIKLPPLFLIIIPFPPACGIASTGISSEAVILTSGLFASIALLSFGFTGSLASLTILLGIPLFPELTLACSVGTNAVGVLGLMLVNE